MALSAARGKLIGVIGDEVSRFCRQPDFGLTLVLLRTHASDSSWVGLENSTKIGSPTSWWSTKVCFLGEFLFSFQCFHSLLDTPLSDIEDCLKKFIKRDDIDIILINQSVSWGAFKLWGHFQGFFLSGGWACSHYHWWTHSSSSCDLGNTFKGPPLWPN